jgi:hypothetical protein
MTDFDPSRGYAAALPHLRAARSAYLAAISGMENPCDKIFSHKWLDPACVHRGCQSLFFAEAVDRLKALAFMARTSGGTAGPDDALMRACDEAEAFLVRAHDRDGAEGGDANAAPVPQDRHARAEGIAHD